MNKNSKSRIQTQATEVGTAVLTAFFTALMFRVGIGMFWAIVWGLVIAYVLRFVALKKLVDIVSKRFFADRPDG